MPCPDALPAPTRPRAWRWISTAQLARDAVRLAALLPPDCAGVVGVPRSGMIPAGVVATILHLPLYHLTPSGPAPVSVGSRGGTLYRAAGPLAVIDDTVYGGHAMARARAALRGRRAVFCAVYVRPEARAAVDLHAAELPCPHLLEYNLPNNGPFWGAASADTRGIYGSGCAVDFDGVLCHDAASGGLPGAPYLLPRAHPVRLVVTGRPESSRPETEAWLRRWGVRWERLEMLRDGVPLAAETAAAHKAKNYAASACGFFIESEPRQAEMIFAATGRPVICPTAEKVFH